MATRAAWGNLRERDGLQICGRSDQPMVTLTSTPMHASSSKSVVIVNGQPGTKIQSCLAKVSSREQVHDLDHVLVRVFAKSTGLRLDDPSLRDSLLSKPEEVIDELWLGAAAESVAWVEAAVTQSNSAQFLTFHASRYSQSSKGFFSPIVIDGLKTIRPRVKMVVVLIDDCFDVFKHLVAPGEMFHAGVFGDKVDESAARFKSISDLQLILQWREQEIAASKRLARDMDAPFFVLAVKHPTSVLQRLVERELSALKFFYLSHPITDVRKEPRSRPPSFPAKLCGFAEAVMKHPDIVLFCPATIDELLFERDGNGRLTYDNRPWQFTWDNRWLHCSPPRELRGVNPLNPRGEPWPTSSSELDRISGALEMLTEEIKSQISSRDIALVRQSSGGIVVHSPLWGGEYSKGIRAELDHHALLADLPDSQRRVLVLETLENIGKFRIQELFAALMSRALPAEKKKALETALKNVDFSWRDDITRVLRFAHSSLKLEDLQRDLLPVLGVDYDFTEEFGTLVQGLIGAAELGEKSKRLARGWETLMSIAFDVSPFDKVCVGFEYEKKLVCDSEGQDFDPSWVTKWMLKNKDN